MARAEQGAAIGVRDLADGSHRRQVARHQCERLVAAPLAVAQTADGHGVAGIAGQVESAQTFNGEDLARGEPAARLLDARGKGRSTLGAGVGLGMKAPVARIVVLRLAGRAHVEGGHGGVGAIVGDIANDGVARAAVGAIGERVAEAAVGGRGEIAEAIVAGGHVG